MMPELGKYAFEVLTSYGVAVALLAALGTISLIRARRMRRDLAALEKRVRKNG